MAPSSDHDPAFTRVTNSVLVEQSVKSFGCGWIDYDNDSDLDLFVANLETANELLKNEGNGTFSRVFTQVFDEVQASFGCSWGDYDNDGLADLFIPAFDHPGYLYHNEGEQGFTRILTGPVAKDSNTAQGSSWADYDNDGDLDLFVVNKGNVNVLYRNDGTGTFTKVHDIALVQERADSHGIAWADFDDDRDLDLFVANNEEGPNTLYRNLGDGTFEILSTSPVMQNSAVSTGGSWGDYDNDGDLDLFVANTLGGSNDLYRNEGKGVFTKILDNVLTQDENNSMGSCWGDYDNDGDLDLFVANSSNQANLLYANDGEGTFRRITTGPVAEDIGASRGCSWGDYDNDGDLDLFVSNAFGADDTNFLYRNENPAQHWVAFRLIGTTSNRSAMGAVVRIQATIGGRSIWQRRDLTSQTGAYGHNHPFLHFGLADASQIDSVVVDWPSGQQEMFTALERDQLFTLTEGQGITEQ